MYHMALSCTQRIIKAYLVITSVPAPSEGQRAGIDTFNYGTVITITETSQIDSKRLCNNNAHFQDTRYTTKDVTDIPCVIKRSFITVCIGGCTCQHYRMYRRVYMSTLPYV